MKFKFFVLFGALALTLSSLSCASWGSGRSCHIEQKNISEGDFKVDISLYSDGKASNKSLLLLPPTGGTNYIDRRYATEFCQAGYDVYLINTWTMLDDPEVDLELHQRTYMRGQQALTLVIEKIKSPFIGLLGTSLGALHSAVAASYQDRLNAVFMIEGGAPISEVIVTSDQEKMRKLYEARQKKYGFKTPTENKEAIDRNFTLEPMLINDGYKKKDIGMVIALDDTTVPTKNQQLLRNYFKPKKVIELSNSHVTGIIRTWLFSSSDIIAFFDESAAGKK